MARPNKKHHKIPKTYLELFTNDKGILWVTDRKFNLFSQKPQNLLTENDYYTVRFEKGGGTLDIETKFLGGIEGKFANIYKNKISKLESISETEKAHLSIFVAAMLERQPMSRIALENFFAQVTEQIKHLRDLSESDKKRMSGMSIFHSNGPSISADEMLKVAEDVASFHTSIIPETVVGIAPIIYDMKWAFMVRPDNSDPYVTSDNPCKMINPVLEAEYGRGTMGASAGLAQENVELNLPLSSDIALICGWELSMDCMYVPVRKEDVDNINRRTRRNAQYLIGCNKEMFVKMIENTRNNLR